MKKFTKFKLILGKFKQTADKNILLAKGPFGIDYKIFVNEKTYDCYVYDSVGGMQRIMLKNNPVIKTVEDAERTCYYHMCRELLLWLKVNKKAAH